MAKQPKNFKSALDYPNHTTQRLLATLENHAALRDLVRTVIPDPLAKQVSDCMIRDDTLVLYTDSANWASQLRFYSSIIRTLIATKLARPIATVKIKILAPHPARAPINASRRPKLPSPDTLRYLRKHIQATQDGELKAALFRLSETLLRKSQ